MNGMLAVNGVMVAVWVLVAGGAGVLLWFIREHGPRDPRPFGDGTVDGGAE